MSDDLHAQLAQRLFGWVPAWNPSEPRYVAWDDPQGVQHAAPPAYTTDPTATAQVWQWLEAQRGKGEWSLAFAYHHGKVSCRIAQWKTVYPLADEDGATWPEALCRAALALADALEAR